MTGELLKGSKNNRRWFVSLVFFMIAVCIMMTTFAFAAETQQYSPTTIIDVKWGDAPEEFGLREGPQTFGASTFSIDKKGNIYILDNQKKNIKKYDSSGNYIGNIGDNNISGRAIAVGSSEEIYLFKKYGDDYSIREYSKEGELIDDFSISKDIELIPGYGQGITLDDQDNLYVNKFQTQYQIGKKQNGRMIKIPHKHVVIRNEKSSKVFGRDTTKSLSVREGLKSRSKANRLIKVGRRNRYEARIFLLTEHGDVEKSIKMNTEGEFGAVHFLEQDGSGYVYVETGRITNGKNIHLDIRKYDEDGNLISIFEVPNDYYTEEMNKIIEVDKAGNVYQLYTTPDGVQIIKWEQS